MNEISFPFEKMGTHTSFEKEAEVIRKKLPTSFITLVGQLNGKKAINDVGVNFIF